MMNWLKQNWKNILILSMFSIIVFYAGRIGQDWQTTKLANQAQAQQQVLVQTQQLLQWTIDNNQFPIADFQKLGYQLRKKVNEK